MKDKQMYKLINNMGDMEKLDFDFDKLVEESNLEEKDIDNIKIKTYEKIGISNVKKYKYKKLVSLIASIALVIVLGGTMAIAIANQLYKYDSSSGRIIKSETPIYILKEPITKNINGGKVTLKSFVVNPRNQSFESEEEVTNIVDYAYRKNELKVNGKDILNEDYEKKDKTEGVSNDWSKGNVGIYDYKKGDKVVYSLVLKDQSGNISSVDFDIELVEANSIEEYNKYLPKDTNYGITMSAISKEEKNTLYIDLMAIPEKDNLEFEVESYGNYTKTNNKTGIYLVDAKGKEVEAKPLEEDNEVNKFKFDIENLQKPFKIKVDNLNIYCSDLKYTNVTLPSLKVDEHKRIDKVIDIEDKNNILTKESSKVLIQRIERTQSDGKDNYNLIVDYIDNDNSNIKLMGISVEPRISIFQSIKKFIKSLSYMIDTIKYENEKSPLTCELSISSSSTVYEDGLSRDITVSTPYSNKKSKKAKLKISGSNYLVEGNWEILIEK